MLRERVILLAAAMSMAAGYAASGKVIYVDANATGKNNGSSWVNAYKYLQDALQSQPGPNDEIHVAQGVHKPDQCTYRPPKGDRSAAFCAGGMVLKGGYAGLGHTDPNVRDPAVYPSILSGDLKGDDEGSVLTGLPSPTRSDNSYDVVLGVSVLDGFVITGAQTEGTITHFYDGGLMIWGNGGTTTIVRDCVFRDNYTDDGGGAVWAGGPGKVVFTGCRFESNMANWWGSGGGAIHSEVTGGVEITECKFVRNGGVTVYAAGEGGMDVNGCDFVANPGRGFLSLQTGAVMMTKCRFIENTGTAATVCSNATKLSDCVFQSNRSGALYIETGVAEVTDSCFAGNQTSMYGGAIFNSGVLKLTRCRLSGNKAVEGGGAIESDSAALTMTNCTISDNRAPQGSALLNKPIYSGFLPGGSSLSNCILSNEGNEIWSDGALMTIQYTAIKGGNSAVQTTVGVQWGPGNLESDPCFVRPGHWDPNGTPADANDDFWVDGDYHLKSQAGRWDPNSLKWVLDGVTSPCIDAGDPNSPVGAEPDPNGGRINMGADGGTKEASKSYSGKPIASSHGISADLFCRFICFSCRFSFNDFWGFFFSSLREPWL